MIYGRFLIVCKVFLRIFVAEIGNGTVNNTNQEENVP